MSSSNSLIHRAITGMPSGPEEEDSFDVDRAARSSAVVMGPVTFEGSKSGVTDDIIIIIDRRWRRWPVVNIGIRLSKLFFYLVNRTGFDTAQGN